MSVMYELAVIPQDNSHMPPDAILHNTASEQYIQCVQYAPLKLQQKVECEEMCN